MKIAVLTPLPPVKSGIAHYSAMILPELARRHEVSAVVDQDEVAFDGCRWMRFDAFKDAASGFDSVVCQLGNNIHHEFVWDWARSHPSTVVLHEIVLHHLLVETTLARGDAAGLVSALEDEYGEIGARVGTARAAGIHGEIANFLLPSSGGIAQGSRHVIVHNRWAADRLRAEGVSTPITVVPHPFEAPPTFSRGEVAPLLDELGWGGAGRVVGAFGFVTSAKRPEVVMEAFGRALRHDAKLRLIFVGEAAPNVDLSAMAERWSIPNEAWRTTGYVSDREFDLWLNAVHRVVSLRYPTAGESSGPIVRAFAVGRPVAVSDYAQFAEIPRELVTRIPFEDEVGSVERFMAGELDEAAIGAAQRAWLQRTSTVGKTIDGYELALAPGEPTGEAFPAIETISVFPRIVAVMERSEFGGGDVVRLTNEGDETITCARWGAPHYLLRIGIVRRDGSREDLVRRLARDLRKGESTTIDVDVGTEIVERIELRHGLSGVPDFECEPFAVLRPGS